MFNSFLQSLKQWNKTNGERSKLQHVYAVLALGLLVIAGLAGLVNDYISQQILALVFGLTIIFFANAVVWALLDSFVLQRITRFRVAKK